MVKPTTNASQVIAMANMNLIERPIRSTASTEKPLQFLQQQIPDGGLDVRSVEAQGIGAVHLQDPVGEGQFHALLIGDVLQPDQAEERRHHAARLFAGGANAGTMGSSHFPRHLGRGILCVRFGYG